MVSFARLLCRISADLYRSILVALVCVLTLAQPAAHAAASLPRFLVVDYHPVSKTLVPSAANGAAQYDYVYRVDVRNAGGEARDVVGTIASKVPALVPTDAVAAFGTVPAYRTKASTDTITIRAGRYFDRRLDRRVATGLGWQYADAGSDVTDQQVPGLPGGFLIWTEALSALYYDLKFQFLFQWSFTQRGDDTAPTIGKLAPQQVVNDARPTISASFADQGDGIDEREVRLVLDGVAVTDAARIADDGITYRPARALAEGPHAVELSVADRAGNRSQASWSFSVDTRAPVVANRVPANNAMTNPGAVIGADYADAGGSGIDIGAVVLKVDRVDVTAQAVRTATGIRYTPAAPLADGTHRVSLQVADLAGNRQTDEWTFRVDGRSVTINVQEPVQGAVLPADALPRIAAGFVGVGTTVVPEKTVLTVDGRNVTADAAVTAQGISYTPRTALAEGTHDVQLAVTDKRGQVTQAAWSFVTRTPPAIGATAPRDTLINAQTPVRITAAYQDAGAGIDVAAIRLLLDGVDVTAQAQVDATQLALVPAAPLPQGVHVVTLTVADKAGNAATTTWRFTIDSGAPVIAGETPKDTLIVTATPRIAATYQDSGELASGIDPARVRLWLDNGEVTAQAQVGASSIAFTPSAPLPGGTHTVRLTVSDRAGNGSESIWSFTVDAQGPVVAASLSPAPGSSVPADQPPVISATYSDDVAGVDPARVQLLVDGVAVSGAEVSATAIRYVPAQPLAEGPHAITLNVVDKGGNAATRSWDFVVRSAPEIDALLPIEGTSIPAGAAVLIKAAYHDAGSGIDTGAIRLTLDGVDVTAKATVQADEAQLAMPAGALQGGAHTIALHVADRAGNEASRSAGFTVEPPATTVISAQQPAKNSSFPAGTRPTIAASFADPAGIDVARVRVQVDEQDVTASANVSATGFSFEAPALAAGRHFVYLRLANLQGRESTAMWTFEIETPGAYRVWFSEPESGHGTAMPRADVRVMAASDVAAVADVTLNGKPMTRVGAANGAVIYGASVDLAPGDNKLTAVARFADNRSRAAETTINYDVAPVVTIATPTDRSTLGAVVATSPRDLTGNVERPVTISGTVSKPVASVTINQQQAAVSGTSWQFEKFFLHEGTNLLTVAATDAQGRVGTASVTVSVDQTAPFLAIEAPVDNAITSANTIDVRGTVNDAVEGYYGAAEPSVTVGGAKGSVTAKVADKQYLAAAVPLLPGLNTLTVTARDEAGNERTAQLRVTRVAAGVPRLTIYGGNAQSAPAGGALPQALTVAAIDAAGQPLAGVPVTFDVTRGTGALTRTQGAADGAGQARNVVVETDANGLAAVWLKLGKQSGPGSNAVRASSGAIAEDAYFVASGEKGPPRHIRADLGINQYVAAGTQPLEPLTAVVTDEHENRIANAEVTFRVAAGEARFENGADSITVKSDKNGYAAVRPTVGPATGVTIVKATPADNGDAFFEATFTLQALQAKDGPTRFSGVVMNDKGQPLPGARMSIGRTALSTTVDDKGLFAFEDVPPGKIDLFVDGRTVNLQGQQYPALHFEATAIKGAQNQLPHPIYLPELQMAEAQIVGGDKDVVLKMPGIEGYEMTVFANSVTFPDGSRTGPLVVSPISFDKLPMTPPGGFAGFMAPAATIQPSGTRFDPPVRLKIPNTAGLQPGEKKPVYQWDHDLATFVQMGQATVTEDGAFLVTDAGTGISKAGWHPIPNPPPPDDCPGSGGSPSCPQCQTVTSSGGKCPVKSCKATSGSCDDKLYCTKDDTCKNGACSGTPVKDEDGATNSFEVNLLAVNQAFGMLRSAGLPVEIDVVKAAFSAQELRSCCESKQGAMVKGTTAKLEAKVGVGFGPLAYGPRLPFPSAVLGRLGQVQVGAFFSGEIGVGVSGSAKGTPCEGTKVCWGGGGSLYLEGTAEIGVVVKDGPIVAAKVTGGLKTGIQAGIELKCTEGLVNASQWNGVTGQIVLEFNDGQIHWERNWVLKEPMTGPEILFALPGLD